MNRLQVTVSRNAGLLDAASFTLYDAAHARAGDKGDRCNLSLIAYHSALFPLLLEQVTEAAVFERFNHRPLLEVRRYILPRLCAMNFVLDGALDGGVTDSLNLDAHGKSLSFLLLGLPISVPSHLRGFLKPSAMEVQCHPLSHLTSTT